MNRKDKQLLMKLNFAAGILHVHGIISQMQRDQIHRKLMKLRDKMEAKPVTEGGSHVGDESTCSIRRVRNVAP